MFKCTEWKDERDRMNAELGKVVTVDNMVELMVKGKNEWRAIETYIDNVMRRKGEDERKEQQRFCST